MYSKEEQEKMIRPAYSKWSALLALMAIAGMLLAACGGSGSQPSAATSAPSGEVATSAPAAATAPAAAEPTAVGAAATAPAAAAYRGRKWRMAS